VNPQTGHLLAICRHLVDPDATVVTTHAGHAGTTILQAATRHGHVIVKTHRGPDRHRQEIHAYQQWTPTLGARTPRLIATCDNPPAIVITAIAGTPLAKLQLDRTEEQKAHRQAGELLRDLHAAAPPRSQPDMTRWLAQRGADWLRLAEPILPANQRTVIEHHLRALADLGPITAVPCHLDYAPRNLLWTADHTTCVIDFEHARYDLAARDLVRMARHVWTGRPELEEAFLDGYGPLTETDRHVIKHGAHLDILTAAVRATGQRLPGPTSGIWDSPVADGESEPTPAYGGIHASPT